MSSLICPATGKASHLTRQKANRQKALLGSRDMQVYHCGVCLGFHVGHRLGSQRNGRHVPQRGARA